MANEQTDSFSMSGDRAGQGRSTSLRTLGVVLGLLTVTGFAAAYVKFGGMTEETAIRRQAAPATTVVGVDCGILVPGANLTDCNLQKAVLAGVDLAGAILVRTNLTGVNLRDTNLTGALLDSATITGSNLRRAKLTNAKAWNLVGLPASLPTNFRLSEGYLVGPEVDLSGIPLPVDLSGAQLRGADLRGADLIYADLRGADLSGADLSGADLTAADLTGARLNGVRGVGIRAQVNPVLPNSYTLQGRSLVGPGVNLEGGVLEGRFDGVDLTGANLAGADISLANLEGATLTGAKSGLTITSGLTRLPSNWQILPRGFLIGPGANLTGADLSGANLNGLTLTAATLDHVRSGGVVGNVVSLPSNWAVRSGFLLGPTADLKNADLRNVDLAGVDLRSADLTGVSLGGNFGRCNPGFQPASANFPDGWRFLCPSEGSLQLVAVGPGVKLSREQVSDWIRASSPFTSGVDLSGVDLSGVDLSGLDLSGSDLTGSKLTDANVTGTNFSTAVFTNVVSGGLIGTPASLPTGGKVANRFLIAPGVDLTGADLRAANLSGADLSGATLKNVLLQSANFTGATLTGVRSGGITPVDLTLPSGWAIRDDNQTFNSGYLVGPAADLSNENLSDLNLASANLSGANLSGANLSGANLSGVNLSTAILDEVRSGRIVGRPGQLTTGWRVSGGWLLGPTANLTGASLAGADLGSLSLQYALLEGVSPAGIVGIPDALPAGWSVIDRRYLVGPGANLSKANFSGINFGNADLTGVDLFGANLTGATVSFANLSGVTSGGILGTPEFGELSVRLAGGYLVGPGFDLTGANLAGVDLSSADLLKANLSGANVVGAIFGDTTLRGVTQGDVVGSPASPTGVTNRNGYLLAPGVNLTNANLSGANLTGLDLTGADLEYADLIAANLTGANLTGANLAGADLIYANLSGANLTGVTWLDTRCPNGVVQSSVCGL